MSAAAASEYDLIEIQKDDREPIAIADKVQKFDYFESVYSPTVTATIGHLDTGNSVHNKKTGLLGTLKDALPVTGFEKVSCVISNPNFSVCGHMFRDFFDYHFTSWICDYRNMQSWFRIFVPA